ncbi:MAG: hypothetical protein V2B20_14865 [Pseudomonadota bacterium]
MEKDGRVFPPFSIFTGIGVKRVRTKKRSQTGQTMGQSKLFKFKEWQTLSEATKYLSTLFGEEIVEADVLRFALDGHLKLSVYFVNRAEVRQGDNFLPFEEWKEKFHKEISWKTLRPIILPNKILAFGAPHFDGYIPVDIAENGEDFNLPFDYEKSDKFKREYLAKRSSQEQAEQLAAICEMIEMQTRETSTKFGGRVPPSSDSFQGQILTIDGIWDLPMLGAERKDIEQRYLQLTDGPIATYCFLDGVFVEGKDNRVFQLQQRWGPEDLASIYEGITDTAKTASGKQGSTSAKPYNDPSNYYGASGLPEDCILVVRTSALREFEDLHFADQEREKRPPSKRQQDSDLHIIGALLEVIVEGQLFSSEEKLRDHIADQYRGYSGCASRTLAGRFAEAKKLLRLAE